MLSISKFLRELDDQKRPTFGLVMRLRQNLQHNRVDYENDFNGCHPGNNLCYIKE
jgi:hypothetical protein